MKRPLVKGKGQLADNNICIGCIHHKAHFISSIFAVGTNSVFLDAESKTMIASGNPKDLLSNSSDQRVIQFLTRGKKQGARQ